MKLLTVICLWFACFALSCGGKCRVTSQCESGEHCNFTTGECVAGCASNAECEAGQRCDVETGRCSYPDRGPIAMDSGTSTVTSTTPDASLPD
jgi:hypothetical protein